MRKPKDKLRTKLDDAQQAQLVDWLLSGMPYHQARELVEKEFGVTVAVSAFSSFWQACCVPHLLVRRRRAVSTANEVAEAAAQNPGQFDQATIDALKQQAFNLAISPNSNPKDVKALFSLVLKARGQDLDEEELRLSRDKFEFDAAESALKDVQALRRISSDSKLNHKEKIEAVRARLFGTTP